MQARIFMVVVLLVGGCFAGNFVTKLSAGRADGSCVGKCDTLGTDPSLPCQCNVACVDYQDCCSDYEESCLSCQDRCDISYNGEFPCQCNVDCPTYGNCCTDYSDLCNGGGGDEITDSELQGLSEELLTLDANAVGNYIVIDVQNNGMGGSDEAPNPLFTSVDPAAFTGPTISPLMGLLDNYDPDTSVTEDRTPEELAEEKTFMDAVMATSIMQTLHQFLVEKGLADSDVAVFQQDVSDAWLTLYSRYGSAMGSSGLEHVFLGEIDEGSVSGFHGWEYFNQEESNGLLNYYGYGSFIDIGQGVSVIEHSFEWQGIVKPISSMFIGSSPELELALYHLCFVARPNSLCPVQLNGNVFNIQTWTQDCDGPTACVGSAYADLSS